MRRQGSDVSTSSTHAEVEAVAVPLPDQQAPPGTARGPKKTTEALSTAAAILLHRLQSQLPRSPVTVVPQDEAIQRWYRQGVLDGAMQLLQTLQETAARAAETGACHEGLTFDVHRRCVLENTHDRRHGIGGAHTSIHCSYRLP